MPLPEAPLPLFPLAAVVLFPETQVPLHVFEPRYRQLMEDVVEGEGHIGMVTVVPEHQSSMSGDPPIFPLGCAGEVAQHQRLPDGRYNLILRATHRFEVISEHPVTDARLYRQADVRLVPEREPTEDGVLAETRETVVRLLRELLRMTTGREAELDEKRLGALTETAFVNTISQALAVSTVEKQGLLEAPGAEERSRRLIDLLRFQIAAGSRGSGPETVH